MVFNVSIALDSMSCARIWALRTHYHHPVEFAISPLRDLVYSRYNSNLLSKTLPALASKQAPFNMEFCNPHLSPRKQFPGVSFNVRSTELTLFRNRLYDQLADAEIFEYVPGTGLGGSVNNSVIAVGEDRARNPGNYSRLKVPVKKKIDNIEMANRILKEISVIDPKELGVLRVLGLRLGWQRTRNDPMKQGEFIPFLGKA